MVRWLEDIDRDDSNTVGSKASNLGELLTQGLDVPRAFVVEADTFDDFLQSSGIKERIESEIAACNVEDHDQLRETSQTIQRRIDNASLAGETEDELTTAYEEIDLNNSVRQAGNKAVELVGGQRENESVVVRSSPVGGREHGVHTPEIGVRGKDDLIEAVKEAWKRYYSPEALYYRQKKGGSDGMAVMVQKMVKADTSCTVFTRHPVGDDNTILIEAVYGIGTALSDGTATPDTFVVDRETGRLQEREVREKHWNISRDPSTGKIQKQRVKRSKRDERTLDSQELSSIVNTALDIEERVGSALKIDFSIGRSKRFILDVARASTARSSGQEATGNELLTGVVAAPGTREGEIAITYDTEALVDPDENIVVSVNPDTALLTSLDRLNGIITENGAISSNLAQLARNFDVPMLVNASSATDILTDGSRVTLDCINGTVIEGSVEPLDRPEPAQRQPLDRPQLTATDLYTLSEQVEHADGTVSIGQGHVRGATWSINAENPQKRIHSEFRDDFQGGAVLVDSFADILRLDEAHKNGATKAFLHLDRLAQEGPQEAVEHALETAQRDSHPECAVIMHSPSPDLLRKAVENGIETVVVPPDRFDEAQRYLEREERRFMLSKLRDL